MKQKAAAEESLLRRAGEQLRKEMLHSESMFSAPNSLGSRQKMK